MTPGEVFELHRGLARRIAFGYLRKLPQSIEAGEIQTVALAGLWDAACRYHDLPTGEFVAVAIVRIRGAISDQLRTQDDFPRRARKSFGKLWKMMYFDGFSTTETIRQFTVSHNIEEDLDDHKRDAWLLDAIETLPAQQKLVMREELSGKTQTEIAQEIGVTAARVCQVSGAARRTLRARWEWKMGSAGS